MSPQGPIYTLPTPQGRNEPGVITMWTLNLRLLGAALLGVGMQTALADDAAGIPSERVEFRNPITIVGAGGSASLISRVETALLRYRAGCATRDERVMAQVFTGHAVIAYTSNMTGKFIVTDANAADKCWPGRETNPLARNSPIWIYPTGDPDDVFVQYSTVVRVAKGQELIRNIALVEMAGDRIAQIRDFGSKFGSER
jgi:hypothetical protein